MQATSAPAATRRTACEPSRRRQISSSAPGLVVVFVCAFGCRASWLRRAFARTATRRVRRVPRRFDVAGGLDQRGKPLGVGRVATAADDSPPPAVGDGADIVVEATGEWDIAPPGEERHVHHRLAPGHELGTVAAAEQHMLCQPREPAGGGEHGVGGLCGLGKKAGCVRSTVMTWARRSTLHQ